MNRSGLRKVTKSVKGKHGSVRRSYWVKANPKAKTMQNAGPHQQGFLRRNAGKIAGAAVLGGMMYLNRNKIAGAARGAGFALNVHKHSGQNASMGERAHDAFHMAKIGWMSNRQMDTHANNAANTARNVLNRARGAAGNAATSARAGVRNLPGAATNWRKGVGADLGRHLASVGGEAAASHVGSHFGSVAGTAIGGLVGGAPGAALGNFLGGHAGSFVAGRHAAPHIARGAEWLHGRLKR